MAQAPFKTTDRAAELVPQIVEIDGKNYKVRRTGKALKKIIELAPSMESQDDDPTANIGVLYAGLAAVLIDPDTGSHPEPDFLEDTLDFEVAQELMDKFVPRRDEGNAPAPTLPSIQDSESLD